MKSEAFQRYVAEFDGDRTAALLDCAMRAQVAVAWIDRRTVELHYRKLADAEWDLLVPALAKYDEHISNYEDAEGEFIDRILARADMIES